MSEPIPDIVKAAIRSWLNTWCDPLPPLPPLETMEDFDGFLDWVFICEKEIRKQDRQHRRLMARYLEEGLSEQEAAEKVYG